MCESRLLATAYSVLNTQSGAVAGYRDRGIMQDNLPLEFLVCPQNRMRLQVAEAPLIERLNRAIAAGQVINAAGRSVEKPIDDGLIRADGQLLYPIVDEIPILLAEEAIVVGRGSAGRK
jgi:uncharacterized protein YbaR (Trm112 family)